MLHMKRSHKRAITKNKNKKTKKNTPPGAIDLDRISQAVVVNQRLLYERWIGHKKWLRVFGFSIVFRYTHKKAYR